MTEILRGKDVADRLTEKNVIKADELRQNGICPTMAIVRLGENPGDLSYERGAMKRAAQTDVDVKQFVYDKTITQDELLAEMDKINRDDSIHGVLIFRPLPGHIDEKAVCAALAPEKDVDGITAGSMAGVFMDSDAGFPPCTAQACMEILDHYGFDPAGKRVAVIGRSLVIGKPVAMMMMRRDATVTICHSRTGSDVMSSVGHDADIIVAAAGKAKMVGPDITGDGKIIIDVGINIDDEGKLCGDVDFDAVSEKAEAITPVPGGVGSVTTAVLMKHVTTYQKTKTVYEAYRRAKDKDTYRAKQESSLILHEAAAKALQTYRALRAFCHFTFTAIQCILKGSRFSGRRYSNEDENIVF